MCKPRMANTAATKDYLIPPITRINLWRFLHRRFNSMQFVNAFIPLKLPFSFNDSCSLTDKNCMATQMQRCKAKDPLMRSCCICVVLAVSVHVHVWPSVAPLTRLRLLSHPLLSSWLKGHKCFLRAKVSLVMTQ